MTMNFGSRVRQIWATSGCTWQGVWMRIAAASLANRGDGFFGLVVSGVDLFLVAAQGIDQRSLAFGDVARTAGGQEEFQARRMRRRWPNGAGR